jgi:hypothetical protein
MAQVEPGPLTDGTGIAQVEKGKRKSYSRETLSSWFPCSNRGRIIAELALNLLAG